MYCDEVQTNFRYNALHDLKGILPSHKNDYKTLISVVSALLSCKKRDEDPDMNDVSLQPKDYYK
ncbi:hypothetical protein GCM10007916_26300 [Psychromonas marina]|uniref:Uncharacterized protein n=1 Tax=Psychromonas marina TaxID=88364 RepID=A0ABQ6E3I5_9GAMM|nr:hypothetical protein GCM10007916_26300 [Psychromonas marina]